MNSKGAGKKPIQLSEAYHYCLSIARQHYENFPTASLLIRRDLRPAVAAIYAFARHADDLADEGKTVARTRLKQLDAWESLLERCTKESVDHPIFLALGDAIERHHLPTSALHDLLVAFRMDVSIHAYATADELLFYCKHSANPVGRLMLALHGIHASEALALSDSICTGLQLANFWQDLSIDLPNGRCYLPEQWLQQAGLDSQALLQGKTGGQQLRPALNEAVAFSRGLFEQGKQLLPYLPFRLKLQVAATLHGGQCILTETTELEDPLQQRAVLSRRHWLQLAWPILWDALLPPARPAMANT